MAIYHLHTEIVKRSDNASATAAAAYQSHDKITDERTGVINDYSRRTGHVDQGIMAPANSPEWVHDRSKLWNAVELAEKRRDAQLARKFDMALPKELSSIQQQQLVWTFAQDELVKRGMIADYALHEPHRTKIKDKEGTEIELSNDNRHVHFAVTMRSIGPDGFGDKNRDWNKRETLEQLREAWATHTNAALEAANRPERIDHRSLAVQHEEAEIESMSAISLESSREFAEIAADLDRPAQRHMGKEATALERKGQPTELGDYNRQIAADHIERKMSRLDKQIRATNNQLREVNAELRTLQATRRQLWQGEQTRRAGMRSNRQIVHSIHQLTYTLVPEPFATTIRVAADLIAAAGKINDWRDAKKYNDQMKLIATATAQSRAEADQNRLALLETKFTLINQKLDAEIDPLKSEKLLGQSAALYYQLEELRESQVQPVPVSNPSPVSPLKPVVAAASPPTQREARPLPPQEKNKLPPQQPAVDVKPLPVVEPVVPTLKEIEQQIKKIEASYQPTAAQIEDDTKHRFPQLQAAKDRLNAVLDKIKEFNQKLKDWAHRGEENGWQREKTYIRQAPRDWQQEARERDKQRDLLAAEKKQAEYNLDQQEAHVRMHGGSKLREEARQGMAADPELKRLNAERLRFLQQQKPAQTQGINTSGGRK